VKNRAFVVGLSVLLLLQVSWILVGPGAGPKLVEIEVGEELPFSIGGGGKYTTVTSADGRSRCHAAFLCTQTCGACSSFAERYSMALNSAPSSLKVGWLIPGDPDATMAWAEAHGLPKKQVLSVWERGSHGFLSRGVVGHIWFTPLRVILTEDLLVRDVRPSDHVPDEATLRFLCDQGNQLSGWRQQNGVLES
jgi:hypothetical protein